MIPGIDLLAVPLGYILWFFYSFIGNYFLSIFLFTLVVRAATFPLSLKSQKMQADRARLTPRLERLQKKYAEDKKKLQEKQMQLYEKEGVSLTGGCLPTIIPDDCAFWGYRCHLQAGFKPDPYPGRGA